MKKVFLSVIVLFTSITFARAQSCSQFINAVNGKKLVYSIAGANGKSSNKVIITSTKKNESTITVHSEMFDKTGQKTTGGDSEITCTGDAINVDIKSFLPPASASQFGKMDMQADGKYLVYPLKLSAGQTLKDGSASIAVNSGGTHFGDILVDITKRRVEKKETISTGAGNFECFRIGYDINVRAEFMGASIPVIMHVTEWFSPKLGRMVKSQTYNKEGNLSGTMMLDAIN